MQLFNEFCYLNNIPEEEEAIPGEALPPHNRRRALFLSHIGTRTLEILNKKCAPYPPNHFPVAALAATLAQVYERPELQSTYRYQFMNRFQGLSESLSDYATELQDLGAKCGFGIHLDDRIRDRFVSGASVPNAVRQYLIGHPQLTFDEQVQYALQAEQLEAQAKVYARNLQLQQVTVAAVHKQLSLGARQQPVSAKVIRRLSETQYLVSAHGVLLRPHINQMSHAALG